MKSFTNEVLLSIQNDIEEKRRKIEDTAICREDEDKNINRQRKFFNVLEDCISELVIEPTNDLIQKTIETYMSPIHGDTIIFTIPIKFQGQLPRYPAEVTEGHLQTFIGRMIEEYHGDKLQEVFPTRIKTLTHIMNHGTYSYQINALWVTIPRPQIDIF
jgi:hypothetical protein